MLVLQGHFCYMLFEMLFMNFCPVCGDLFYLLQLFLFKSHNGLRVDGWPLLMGDILSYVSFHSRRERAHKRVGKARRLTRRRILFSRQTRVTTASVMTSNTSVICRGLWSGRVTFACKDRGRFCQPVWRFPLLSTSSNWRSAATNVRIVAPYLFQQSMCKSSIHY